MEFHFIPSQEPAKSQQRSRRLSQAQVRLLENSFNSNHKLQAERKLQLATRLGVSPRQVAIWYQNRRARHKNQTIEFDYRTIQMRLDHALADKRRLEKEVLMLKTELFKAREMLGSPCAAYSHDLPQHVDDRDHASETVDDLPVEDLYTCLSPWP